MVRAYIIKKWSVISNSCSRDLLENEYKKTYDQDLKTRQNNLPVRWNRSTEGARYSWSFHWRITFSDLKKPWLDEQEEDKYGKRTGLIWLELIACIFLFNKYVQQWNELSRVQVCLAFFRQKISILSFLPSNLSYPHIVQQPSLYAQQYSNTLTQVSNPSFLDFRITWNSSVSLAIDISLWCCFFDTK